VDLLRAAAAREAIPLEWVFAPDGPEKALVSTLALTTRKLLKMR
jgi:hypothetical protein